MKVRVYEQAKQFARLGAGIQMSPNAMRVLRGLGLEPRIRAAAFQPPRLDQPRVGHRASTSELPLGAEAEAKYGAPYLLMHRGDLHEALVSPVPAERIALDKKLVDLDCSGARRHAALRRRHAARGRRRDRRRRHPFARARDPARAGEAELHRPRRATAPRSRPRCWAASPSTTAPSGGARTATSSSITSRADARRGLFRHQRAGAGVERRILVGDAATWASCAPRFAGFHERGAARAARRARSVHKWALFERDPLPRWGEGPMVLLGDACHPMTPYMAQGAASALEDAAVLARCIDGVRTILPRRFRRYEAPRRERTARIQLTSRQNTWHATATSIPTWVYGYDAWRAPIAEAGARAS